MAVVAQIVVENRRYSGWIDPRYPIGYWQAGLDVTGDATGGRLSIDLLFQPAAPAFLNSQMYSVERISLTADDGTNRIAKLFAVNMGGPANLGFEHQYAIFLEPMTGLGESALVPVTMNLLPWFLGSQRTAGISASLSYQGVNSNGVLFRFEAEGYRWGARSVLIDGGPQRPPTGPYRA